MPHSERKGKAKKLEDDQDRISVLPVDVIQCILSLLPTKDAVRISTLSRTWLYAWNSFPVSTLKFASDDSRSREETFWGPVANFFDTLFVLPKKEAIFVNFHVSWPSFHQDTYLFEICIYLWMVLVARHRIRELEIDVLPEKVEEEKSIKSFTTASFALRKTLFAASESLVVLRLRGCRMSSLSSPPIKSISLVSLRVLFWEHDFLDGQEVEELLAHCPVLEECTLISVFKKALRLVLSGHRKLKQVKIDGFLKVIIQDDMPSLQVLDITNFWSIEGENKCNGIRNLTPKDQGN